MYFTIQRSKEGQCWWRAVGDNNEIMAASELMKSKQSVEHAISVIQAEAADARILDPRYGRFSAGRDMCDQPAFRCAWRPLRANSDGPASGCQA